MIKGFRHKGLEVFFTTGSMAGIQAAHKSKLARQLNQLNQASQVQDMNIAVGNCIS